MVQKIRSPFNQVQNLIEARFENDDIVFAEFTDLFFEYIHDTLDASKYAQIDEFDFEALIEAYSLNFATAQQMLADFCKWLFRIYGNEHPLLP